MNKIITTFLFLVFMASLISSVMETGGGVVSTRLTEDITSSSTIIHVSNNRGFLDAGVVYIGNEAIKYIKPIGATNYLAANPIDGRGFDNTEAVAHVRGDMVYTKDMSALNSALGFEVASTGSSTGEIQLGLTVRNFFFITIPRIATWDYGWLKLPSLLFLRMLLSVFTMGFIIYIVYQILSALGGVAQSIFTRV